MLGALGIFFNFHFCFLRPNLIKIRWENATNLHYQNEIGRLVWTKMEIIFTNNQLPLHCHYILCLCFAIKFSSIRLPFDVELLNGIKIKSNVHTWKWPFLCFINLYTWILFYFYFLWMQLNSKCCCRID